MRDLTDYEIHLVSGGSWDSFWSAVREDISAAGQALAAAASNFATWFNNNFGQAAVPNQDQFLNTINTVCQSGQQITTTVTGTDKSITFGVNPMTKQVTMTATSTGGSMSLNCTVK